MPGHLRHRPQWMTLVARNRPAMAVMPPKAASRAAPKAAMSPLLQASTLPATDEPITATDDQIVCDAQNGLKSFVSTGAVMTMEKPFRRVPAAGRLCAPPGGGAACIAPAASASAAILVASARLLQPRPNVAKNRQMLQESQPALAFATAARAAMILLASFLPPVRTSAAINAMQVPAAMRQVRRPAGFFMENPVAKQQKQTSAEIASAASWIAITGSRPAPGCRERPGEDEHGPCQEFAGQAGHCDCACARDAAGTACEAGSTAASSAMMRKFLRHASRATTSAATPTVTSSAVSAQWPPLAAWACAAAALATAAPAAR